MSLARSYTNQQCQSSYTVMIKAFIRFSQGGDYLEFWPEIHWSSIDGKDSGRGRFFQQPRALEVMQIVEDVTVPEFGRLLRKIFVLSFPYFYAAFIKKHLQF